LVGVCDDLEQAPKSESDLARKQYEKAERKQGPHALSALSDATDLWLARI